ncbi:MAG TPA: alkaline phosphatase family protein, partial [Candidatus Eisenbacteria bacterium]|nr:alkaline phosphatase family protein [Candidatus Eisenbacteria bacterium]
MPPVRRLVLVLVVDGLRPDSITAEDTPTLFRLRAEGVDLVNSHAVFPTVTRVNAAAIATGTQPGTNGLVGNQMFVPAVDDRRAFDTGDHRNFLALGRATGGRVLQAPTLAERLHARGLRLAGVSSGSTGSAFLLNPKSVAGVGALVNGYLEPGRTVAYPAPVSEAVLARFGPAPAKAPGGARFDASVNWTQRVLREYVLPALAPDVVINWLTEPDHSQHHVGVGSPAAREALRNDDREIAQVLAGLDAALTSVLVVSDHGFTTNTAGVDVAGALIEAKLKAARDSTDVILASSGQAVALHVEGHDAARIARLARFVQAQDWGGVVFSAQTVDGAFPLELINVANRDRGPDLLFTFPWTSRRSAFGVPGTDLANVSAGGSPYVSDHGSMSPWNVRNTFLAWGAGVKKGIIARAPAGNVDVTPTVLAQLGLEGEAGLDGRVVAEALQGGPDPEAPRR